MDKRYFKFLNYLNNRVLLNIDEELDALNSSDDIAFLNIDYVDVFNSSDELNLSNDINFSINIFENIILITKEWKFKWLNSSDNIDLLNS